jgi:hypothetical protein
LSRIQETKEKLLKKYGKLPLTFIPNEGQVHEKVQYYTQGLGRTFYFTKEEAVFTFRKASSKKRKRFAADPQEREHIEEESPIRGMNLALQFIDANPHVEVEGQHEAIGKVNYFIGNDPTKWVTDLSTYHEVVYRELWPGIDLLFTEKNGRLKYDFIVRPGANIEDIRLRYHGAEHLSLDEAGNLEIHTRYGILLEEQPVSMQEIEGQQVPVTSSFLLKKDEDGEWEYGFQTGHDFDPRYPLIIDPTLVYSTYLGGSDFDASFGIAVDSSGSAYVTGFTTSTDFPTQNPFQEALAGGLDAFVTKFSPEGNTLLFSTYLGGSGNDVGNGIAVDSSGSAYVTGDTSSTDFPTQNPFQGALAGGDDAFVTKLSPTGNALLYSTYLGGSNTDVGNGIAVDSSGSAYVTGITTSTDFPTQNPFQGALAGGFDAFVTKLGPTGNTLLFSTYLGGSGNEFGNGIAVDSSGSAYVTGITDSPNFPTQNPFQGTFAGGSFDAFVTKFSSTGNSLVYSTYLGGSGDDEGRSIAVDSSGAAYVTGVTDSPNFPTQNPFQGAFAGGPFDAFVTKFSSTGNSLVYSTYLGGSGDDDGNGIAVDSSGAAYVTGFTDSPNFPTQNPFQGALAGSDDAFVTKIGPTTPPCIPNITLNITQLDTRTFEITGRVTCSGESVSGAIVTFTSSLAGTGSVFITPNPVTTDEFGNFTATMTAVPGTSGIVTVTASTMVNGVPVSITQSQIISSTQPISPQPDCICVPKVYDWVVFTEEINSTVPVTPVAGCPTTVTDITCSLVTEPFFPITCATNGVCTVLERRPINIDGVNAALVKLRQEIPIDVTFTGTTDGAAATCTIRVTVPFIRQVVLCFPPEFTNDNLVCRIISGDCTITTPAPVGGEPFPTSIGVELFVCKEVQVLAAVKLEVLAKFCSPRAPITPPVTSVCPPLTFPEQCNFFPQPNCDCEGFVNDTCTISVLSGATCTLSIGATAVTSGTQTINATICNNCSLTNSSIFYQTTNPTQSFTFNADTFASVACTPTGSATPTTLVVTGTGTVTTTAPVSNTIPNVAYTLTLTEGATTDTWTLVLTGPFTATASNTLVPDQNLIINNCNAFPSPSP